MGGIWEEKDEIASLQAIVQSLRKYFEEKEMKSKEKKSNVGFALQLIWALFFTYLGFIAIVISIMFLTYDFETFIRVLIAATVVLLLGLFFTFLSFKGRKHNSANIVLLILIIPSLIGYIIAICGGVVSWINGYLSNLNEIANGYVEIRWGLTIRSMTPFIVLAILHIIGLIGTIRAMRELKRHSFEEAVPVQPQDNSNNTQAASLSNRETTALSMKASLLDATSFPVWEFSDEHGESISMQKVDVLYSDADGSRKLYAMLRIEGADDHVIYVAVYDEATDSLSMAEDSVAEKVFAQWRQSAPSGGAVQESIKLDLEDTIVHKKDWKAFRKRATQEELLTLAIGSKYRIAGFSAIVKGLVSVVGVILSVVLGVTLVGSIGFFAIFLLVAGYLFFNLLASKVLGYSDTYRDCRSRLQGEYRQKLDNVFRDCVAVKIVRVLVMALLTIVTIPYKFLLIIIETLIPAAGNWTVAHGGEAGAVITLPKGADIGNLGAIGAYYASQKFGDVWEQQIKEWTLEDRARYKKYVYRDKYGVEQTAYSKDGVRFYDSPNGVREVGYSSDGGKTIETK